MKAHDADPAEAARPESLLPAVIAIVVSYNSRRDLTSCLASLEAQRGVDLRIHVVDNASSDGSADLVRRGFPRVLLSQNDRNVGFSRANNQVLEREAAPYYALVNPDTVLPPDAVVRCVNYVTGHPEAGVAATKLAFPDGRLQRSCHSFLGFLNLLGETIGAHRLAPSIRPLASFYMPWFGHDRIAEVDWIQGAFLVVRGDVVRRVGGLDPEFFMFGEEMDWCRRIRSAGWRTVFLPDPVVVHVGGASSGPIAGPMFVENLKGRIRFLRKHEGALVAAAARGIIALSVVLRFLWRELQALWLRLRGRSPGEALEQKQRVFRAGLRWVAQGLPLSPPG